MNLQQSERYVWREIPALRTWAGIALATLWLAPALWVSYYFMDEILLQYCKECFFSGDACTTIGRDILAVIGLYALLSPLVDILVWRYFLAKWTLYWVVVRLLSLGYIFTAIGLGFLTVRPG